jgi:lipoate-protein ligase A
MTGLKILDRTYNTPAEDLACDEALLDACESGASPEVLRFWEPKQHFIVLGYANKASVEADLEACARRRVSVLRRCSGGGAVLQGPGCLNYSLILRFENAPALQSITDANASIMSRNRDALAAVLGQPVAIQGTTDLTMGRLKFSGNAQRRKKHCLLFHGTFLVDFDLELVQECLRPPSRQPDYRQQRSHAEFLTNLHTPVDRIKKAMQNIWLTDGHLNLDIAKPMERLVAEKYSREDWNLKW